MFAKIYLRIFSYPVEIFIRLAYLNEYKIFAKMHQLWFTLLYDVGELIGVLNITDMLALWQW